MESYSSKMYLMIQAETRRRREELNTLGLRETGSREAQPRRRAKRPRSKSLNEPLLHGEKTKVCEKRRRWSSVQSAKYMSDSELRHYPKRRGRRGKHTDIECNTIVSKSPNLDHGPNSRHPRKIISQGCDTGPSPLDTDDGRANPFDSIQVVTSVMTSLMTDDMGYQVTEPKDPSARPHGKSHLSRRTQTTGVQGSLPPPPLPQGSRSITAPSDPTGGGHHKGVGEPGMALAQTDRQSQTDVEGKAFMGEWLGLVKGNYSLVVTWVFIAYE